MNKTPSWFARPVMSWYYFVLVMAFFPSFLFACVVDGGVAWQATVIAALFAFGTLATLTEAEKRERLEKEALMNEAIKYVTEAHNDNLAGNKSRIRLKAELLPDGGLATWLFPTAKSRKLYQQSCSQKTK